MGTNSKIEWTDHTFNPWIGCTKVAPGCEHCYAEAFAKRYGKAQWGPAGTRVKTTNNYWQQPLKWNRDAAHGVCIDCGAPIHNDGTSIDCDCGQLGACGEARRPRVFCTSLADVFEDWEGPIHNSDGDRLSKNERGHNTDGYPDPWTTMNDLRRDLFALIDSTPYIDWLLLTKRPENIRRMWPAVNIGSQQQADDRNELGELYRRNAWLLTSIATQADADRNVPELIKCSALVPVLGISAEPLLEQIELQWNWISTDDPGGACPACGEISCHHTSIDWIIAGGESGPHARPMHPDWVRSLRDQCQAAGIPFYFKQWGEWCEYQVVPGGDLGGDCRRGKATIVAVDGSTNDGHFRRARGDMWMRRVGKKAAGRSLDDKLWSEFPTLSTARSRSSACP